MPQLQNISISGASVSIEDDSMTKKVLPMIAAMQGMDGGDSGGKHRPVDARSALMQLQNEAFAQRRWPA